MDTPVLAVRHVSKSFAGVRALVDIDLEIAPGEIHCLVGENGSGKSTLIKVISGVHTPEHGTVSIDGRDFTRLTPAAAIDAGVRVIYQDFSIFPNLSVMENIALGSEVAAGRCLVNRSRMREVAREAVAKIGFDVDLDELGLKGKVFTVGTGMPAANAQILKDGSVSTLTLWDPANAGYAMASLATKILNGETIEDGVNLGVEGYESMHFSSGSTKVLEGTGWLKITKDNVDSLGF